MLSALRSSLLAHNVEAYHSTLLYQAIGPSICVLRHYISYAYMLRGVRSFH